MRPTLAEQLRGIRTMLDRVVAPAVGDDYAHDTLLAALRALEMLENRVDEVGPFLAWDNEATRALLDRVAARVPGTEPPSRAAEPRSDLRALDAENEQLRASLADAVLRVSADPDLVELHRAIVAHLRERITRYPYASTGTLPSR